MSKVRILKKIWQSVAVSHRFSIKWTLEETKMIIDSLTLKENFQNDVRECVKKKDWRKILLLCQKNGLTVTSETLWTFPSEYCLNYLQRLWKSFDITSILSVGCGSGLLEFIMHESIGLFLIILRGILKRL